MKNKNTQLDYDLKLNRNLKLFFPFLISQNRIFYILISLYFLTLPGASEKIYMLGWFISISSIISFFVEIPSGYFSDRFGYKKTLILSKLLMIVSTLIYVLANSWIYFLLASIFQWVSGAFQSGAYDALHHNTMIALDKENEYTKSASKLSSNVAIVVSLFLILMPFLAELNILYPFYLALIIDVLVFFSLFFFVEPKYVQFKESAKEILNLKVIFQETKTTGFLSFSSLMALLSGIGMSILLYQEAWFVSLGAPVAFVGLAAGLSQVVLFLVGHQAHKIEKIFSIKQLLLFRTASFVLTVLVISIIQNYYLAILLVGLNRGLEQGTKSIFKAYFLRNYIFDERYKATILSMDSQIDLAFKVVLPVLTGYLIGYSYQEGFLYLGIISVILVLIIWRFLWKKI